MAGAVATRDSNRCASTAWAVDVEPVAAGNGRDDVRAERPAQARDEGLQCVADGVGRVGAPQVVDQGRHGQRTAGVQREPGERAAQQDPAGRRRIGPPGGHRAEQADPHAASVPVSPAFAISSALRERVRRAAGPRRARRARTSRGAGSRRCRASGVAGSPTPVTRTAAPGKVRANSAMNGIDPPDAGLDHVGAVRVGERARGRVVDVAAVSRAIGSPSRARGDGPAHPTGRAPPGARSVPRSPSRRRRPGASRRLTFARARGSSTLDAGPRRPVRRCRARATAGSPEPVGRWCRCR